MIEEIETLSSDLLHSVHWEFGLVTSDPVWDYSLTKQTGLEGDPFGSLGLGPKISGRSDGNYSDSITAASRDPFEWNTPHILEGRT
jgi:hypothetical protein